MKLVELLEAAIVEARSLESNTDPLVDTILTPALKEAKQISSDVKLHKSGMPLKAEDWTEQDWSDLHFAIDGAIKKIAARHSTH